MHAGFVTRRDLLVEMRFKHYIGPTTVEDWLTRDHPTDGSRLELAFGYLHTSPPPTGQHQYAGSELRISYAHANVPYFWEISEDLTLVTHVLKDGQYVEDLTAKPGTTVTINAAPVPVTFDPAILHP